MTNIANSLATSPSNRSRRGWLVRLVVGTLVGFLVLIGATVQTPAEAQVLERQGAVGATAPGIVRCYYYNYRGNLSARAYGPAATAYPRYAGAGNDWQQVRYRVFWYSAFNGSLLKYSGWSGLVRAGDSAATAAYWSGYSAELWRYDAQISVGYQFEFYNWSTGKYEGTVTDWQPTYLDYQEDQSSGSSSGRCVSSYGNVS